MCLGEQNNEDRGVTLPLTMSSNADSHGFRSHIEEESEIFPQVEKAKMDFEESGPEIAERKAILTGRNN
jgi:hypothetical protein